MSVTTYPIGPDGRYFLPKLSAPELRAIYTRNPCPEVRELLWEVHRLRQLVLRAWQLQDTLATAQPPATQLILDILRRDLAGEPCIAEQQAWESEFFGPRELRSSTYALQRYRRD